jgi:thiol-disulfide isomerase/thioredoxin
MKKILTAALVLAFVLSASGCSLLNIFVPATVSDSPSTPSISVVESSASPSASEPASDGIMSDFTAADLDGNAVDQSIFSGHKLTMVNIWATFCGPCINEMPELGDLNRDLADKGFQVVGIVADASDGKTVDNSLVKTARDIIGQTGADYLHILPSTDLMDGFLSEVMAVPTTIFVDEYGNQVGKQYVGSRDYEGWAAVIDELLGQV